MRGNIISHARGGHACAKKHLCNPPISSYVAKPLLQYEVTALQVADNYFRDGPRDLPKEVTIYVDFNIVIDINAEFDHALDATV